jgi:hypothetical protein
MAMAGDRCQNGECTCRSVDDYNRGGVSDEKGLTERLKRFEIRTGRGLFPMEITVTGSGTLKKMGEKVDASCGYLDLAPGKHKIHLHAKATSEAEGMAPTLFINEWSARTHDWYDAFVFKCGSNGPCTKDDMTQWNDTEGKRPRGIFDPCGSTRVEGIKWDLSHSPDVKVMELDMDFVLEVYKFTPRFPHGGKTCKGAGGVEREDQPQDLPQ